MMEATLNDPQWSRMFMVCLLLLFFSLLFLCLCKKKILAINVF